MQRTGLVPYGSAVAPRIADPDKEDGPAPGCAFGSTISPPDSRSGGCDTQRAIWRPIDEDGVDISQVVNLAENVAHPLEPLQYVPGYAGGLDPGLVRQPLMVESGHADSLIKR